MAKQPKRQTRVEKESAHVEEEPTTGVDTVPLSFLSPESRTIAGADYNPDTETLTVLFRTGKSYTYNPFPPELWAEFEMAASKGSFFAQRIRPLFAGRLVL